MKRSWALILTITRKYYPKKLFPPGDWSKSEMSSLVWSGCIAGHKPNYDFCLCMVVGGRVWKSKDGHIKVSNELLPPFYPSIQRVFKLHILGI